MPSRAKLSRKATKKVNYADEIESESDGTSSELNDQDGSYGKKNSKKGGKEKDGEDSDNDDDDDEFNSKKVGAKSKKTKRKGRKMKGKQDDSRIGSPFDQVPFELLCEILSLVDPEDLLAFAKVNKYYRSVLKSTDSSRIWKIVRRGLELPDLQAEDFSEYAYAALLWEHGCQHCLTAMSGVAETWLRVRLCKACLKKNIVRVDARFKKDCRYHPATFDCVKTSPRSPNGRRFRVRTGTRCALVRDLDYYHEKLSKLQKADEEDRSLGAEEPEPAPDGANDDAKSGRPRQSRRDNLREKKTGPVSYKEIDEEVEVVGILPGGRVSKLVETRKKLLEKIDADGTAMYQGYARAQELILTKRRERDHSIYLLESAKRTSVEESLKERLLTLDGYEPEDLSFCNYRTLDSIVKPGTLLTDELWETIQPQLLKAIDNGKVREQAEQRRQDLYSHMTSRQRSCRPYYESLKSSSEKGTCFPLFDNFLLLPSVKLLWGPEPEDTEEDKVLTSVDESAWKLVLPLIKAEVEEYHLDFVTLAVRLILSAHREFEAEDVLEEAIQETLEGDLDSFLSLATSLVMCEKCRGLPMPVTSGSTGFRGYRTIYRTEGGFIGSLTQVATHLAAKHNTDNPYRRRQSTLNYPVCLPLQVASTISALLDVGDYSADRATVSDLQRLDRGAYEWENVPTSIRQGRFSTWKGLVEEVSLASYKAEKKRIPIHLPAPVIAYYPALERLAKPSLWSSDEEMSGSSDDSDA